VGVKVSLSTALPLSKMGKRAHFRASWALKSEKIIGSIFLRMRVTIPGMAHTVTATVALMLTDIPNSTL
jgi:hypothetical protein